MVKAYVYGRAPISMVTGQTTSALSRIRGDASHIDECVE
jgi:hypothetical protein